MITLPASGRGGGERTDAGRFFKVQKSKLSNLGSSLINALVQECLRSSCGKAFIVKEECRTMGGCSLESEAHTRYISTRTLQTRAFFHSGTRLPDDADDAGSHNMQARSRLLGNVQQLNPQFLVRDDEEETLLGPAAESV